MKKDKELEMVQVLMQNEEAKINLAIMNTSILLKKHVGVGDHPNVIETIQGQLDIMSQNKDRLNILMEYFDGED